MLLMFLGLICFAVLAILRRDLALYLIVLLLPTYQIRFSILGIPATFLEGMILILAAASLLPLPRRERIEVRGRLTANKWTIVFISFFLLAAFISVFTSPNLTAAAGIFKAYFFEAVLFSFLVMLIIDSSEKLQRLYKTLALLVLYLSIFGIYQFITLYNLPFNWWAVDVESRRIISLLNHPNALALLIGPILAMLIMLRGSQKSVLYWSAIILGLVALYLSFSRASWLALLVTVIGITIIHHRSPSPPLRVRGGWGALLLSIIVILVLTIPFSRAKLLDLARGRDLSQQNRYVLWSAAGDILKNSPITGTGLAGFREAYKNYPLGPDLVVQNYPHNFFLNFWT
ncbi:MAG: O-antigen ligase family protein, partial [bacterium]|nr:O-antigen ligase family protein [bacterium]